MPLNDERLRFELLQEKLDELDCLALTGESAAAPQPIHPASGQQTAAAPAALTQMRESRAALLEDFRRDLARIAAEAESAYSASVEDRLNRLKTITDEMTRRFLAEIDAAMRQSAGVMASQALRLAEEEILLVARRGIEEFTAASRREPSPGEDQQPNAAAISDPGRIAEAVMTKVEARLTASLRAFEEQAARRLAERIGAIVQDLLAREKASNAAIGSNPISTLTPKISPLPTPPNDPPSASTISPSPEATAAKAALITNKTAKKSRWTVLGLG